MLRLLYSVFLISSFVLSSQALGAPKLAIFDPTRPADYKGDAAEGGTVGLTSIYFAKDQRYAIINDAIVTEGDVISGAKVIAIDKTSVTLLDEQQQKTVLQLVENIKR